MTLKEFKAFNKRIGHHWFDPGTMRFHGSVIAFWDSMRGFFISSELDFYGEKRSFSIRKADFLTGRVTTISNYDEFENFTDAAEALKKLL